MNMNKFLNIAKIPGIVVGCIGALYTVFSFALNPLKDDMLDTKEMVNYNNMQIEGVSQQMFVLQDTAEDIKERQIEQGNQINNLSWIVRHRNDYTEEQLEDLMDLMMRRSLLVVPREEEVSESHSSSVRDVPHYRGEVEFIAIDTLPIP
jgi:hypothetical protein